jgi:anaerobic magnesium-protoporphyrin IX monomethyl ester cyclase
VKAIFVNTPLHNYDLRPRHHDFTLPVLGLGYIATVAAYSDLNVGVLDGEANGLGLSGIASEVNRQAPEWVGFNLLAPTYKNTVAVLQQLDPAIKVMLGGHQAKALPEVILADLKIPRIDALILGEAEYRVAALLEGSCGPSELPRVLWREGGQVGSGPETHENSQYLSPDINEMPFVDRNFFAQDPYTDGYNLEAAIVGSRGCPFDCSFCGAAVSANRDIAILLRESGQGGPREAWRKGRLTRRVTVAEKSTRPAPPPPRKSAVILPHLRGGGCSSGQTRHEENHRHEQTREETIAAGMAGTA